MTTTNQLVYLAVLSQSFLDTVYDLEEKKIFRQRIKNLINNTKNELIKLVGTDFESVEAIQQLLDISKWHNQLFQIQVQLWDRSETDTKNFDHDFNILLQKHNLNPI